MLVLPYNFLPSLPPTISFRPTTLHQRSFRTTPTLSYLTHKVDIKGVTYSDLDDSCVVGLSLENGIAAKLMVPSGLITSFKAPMWHGGKVELLHTTVSQNALIQGGLSVALTLQNEEGISFVPNHWEIHKITGNHSESIQVELVGKSNDSCLQIDAQVKYLITLGPDYLTSQIVICNTKKSILSLTGSVMAHLTVSTPDATYALGLKGSDYFIRPPVVEKFSIIPPDSGKKKDLTSNFKKMFFNWENGTDGGDDDSEGQDDLDAREEDSDYKHLTKVMSRIYTSAPRYFTIMDRGRRNSVTVRRDGFDELYIFSPGSEHEMYNKYSYLCIGHAAMLTPIILDNRTEWRGGLRLWNPNS